MRYNQIPTLPALPPTQGSLRDIGNKVLGTIGFGQAFLRGVIGWLSLFVILAFVFFLPLLLGVYFVMRFSCTGIEHTDELFDAL